MSERARKRLIDWYAGTLLSRLSDKKHGPIVVVMQRLHKNDLAGHLLGQGGGEHLDRGKVRGGRTAAIYEYTPLARTFSQHCRKKPANLVPAR
jgi:hypothetical protein